MILYKFNKLPANSKFLRIFKPVVMVYVWWIPQTIPEMSPTIHKPEFGHPPRRNPPGNNPLLTRQDQSPPRANPLCYNPSLSHSGRSLLLFMLLCFCNTTVFYQASPLPMVKAIVFVIILILCFFFFSFFFLPKRSLADKHETCTGMDPKWT